MLKVKLIIRLISSMHISETRHFASLPLQPAFVRGLK